MKYHRLLWATLGLTLFLVLHISAPLSARAAKSTARPPAASLLPLTFNSRAEGELRRAKDSRIRTCAEVGLCQKGEARLLLKGKAPREVFSALLKGCRAKRWLNDNVVLKCPEGVSIPGATTERVFKTQDVFSVTQINAALVQQQNVKGSGVKVAVLDTGIDDRHPEVAGRIAAKTSLVADSTFWDVHGHGTHVAGIIAGQGISTYTDDNGTNRIVGVSPEVSLLIGKVCADGGWCAEGDILAGIEWAVSQGAKVINLSLGGGAFMSHCDGDPLAAKVNWAVNQGTVVVVSSGNGAAENPGVSTPACASKAVAVGALDRSDVRQVWSGNGPALDLMAPGLGILSSLPCAVSATCPEAGYGWWSGTSMAAPHVAGVVALIRGANPALSADDVRMILQNSAYDLGSPGFDESNGYGRVNAASALRLALDHDSDGSPIPADCNDNDPSISPLMQEKCGNGKDDDCDGSVDEGCVSSSSSSSAVSSVSSSSFVSSVSSSSSSSVSSVPSSSAASSSSSATPPLPPVLPPPSSSSEREDDHDRENGGRSSASSQGNESDQGRSCPWWSNWVPWFSDRCRERELPDPGNRPIEVPPGQLRNRNSRD